MGKNKKKWRVIMEPPETGSFTFAEALKAVKELQKENDTQAKKLSKRSKRIKKTALRRK